MSGEQLVKQVTGPSVSSPSRFRDEEFPPVGEVNGKGGEFKNKKNALNCDIITKQVVNLGSSDGVIYVVEGELLETAVAPAVIEEQEFQHLSETTYQHNLHVNHQVLSWYGCFLSAENWGCKVGGNIMVPIKRDKSPAPNHILQLITCNCKTRRVRSSRYK